MRESRHERSHQKVWDLLPWYVNGTLPAEERSAVEVHLGSCLRCREEVRSCQTLEEMVQGSEELAPSPHPVQLARLLTRIDEAEREEAKAQSRGRRLAAALLALMPRIPRPASPVRGMLAAQLAVLLLIAGVVLWQQWQAEEPPAVYRTFSDPAPAAGEGTLIRMRFAEDTPEREIRELLLSVRGEIVAGPSPFGIYTVEVAPRGDSLPGVLTHLRAQPKVQFAEPAAGQER